MPARRCKRILPQSFIVGGRGGCGRGGVVVAADAAVDGVDYKLMMRLLLLLVLSALLCS